MKTAGFSSGNLENRLGKGVPAYEIIATNLSKDQEEKLRELFAEA